MILNKLCEKCSNIVDNNINYKGEFYRNMQLSFVGYQKLTKIY